MPFHIAEWTSILGKANSYFDRLPLCRTPFKCLFGNYFQNLYSGIINSSFFDKSSFLPRLIGLMLGHFQTPNSLSENKCLPPWRRKVPSGSERNSERESDYSQDDYRRKYFIQVLFWVLAKGQIALYSFFINLSSYKPDSWKSFLTTKRLLKFVQFFVKYKKKSFLFPFKTHWHIKELCFLKSLVFL